MAGRMDTNSTLSSVAPYSSRVSVSIPYVRHKFDIQVLDQVIFANVYVSIFLHKNKLTVFFTPAYVINKGSSCDYNI